MRVLFAGQIPKDPEYPEEIEDTLCVPEECNRVALSDGASESFDSKTWAEVLVRGYAEQPEFDGDWLRRRIKDYLTKFDPNSLSWSKLAAFERGSFATLLGLQHQVTSSTAEVLAIGDTLAVLCDGTEFLDSFPYIHSEEFDRRPELVSTLDVLNADFESREFILHCKRSWNAKGMRNPVDLPPSSVQEIL